MAALGDRITVRLTVAQTEHLQALSRASGLSRNEVVRRMLSNQPIPSVTARREIQAIVRVQREQNRLGGLLKHAFTGQGDKGALRQTLAEIERNAKDLRRLVAVLVDRL